MTDKNQIEMALDRQRIKLAFGALNIAIREISQVARNLTLAQLAMMQNDQTKAIEELGEINTRLDEVNKYLENMTSLAKELVDER